jgi:hypothetical protein
MLSAISSVHYTFFLHTKPARKNSKRGCESINWTIQTWSKMADDFQTQTQNGSRAPGSARKKKRTLSDLFAKQSREDKEKVTQGYRQLMLDAQGEFILFDRPKSPPGATLILHQFI